MPWTPVGKFEWPVAWGLLTDVPEQATRWPLWAEVGNKPATYTPSLHTHAAADITSGTLANARISQASVTQHQAALAVDWTQLFNVGQLGAWRALATTAKADSAVSLSAGAGLEGGGNLTQNRSFALGTPSQITPSTTNSVTGTSHTHALNTSLPEGMAAGVAPVDYPQNTVSALRVGSAAGTGWPVFGVALNVMTNNSRHGQVFFGADDFWLRSGVGSSWGSFRKAWHDGNLDPANFMQLQAPLGAGADLNNVTSTGIYHQPLNANATTALNYPIGFAGALFVYASSSMVYQTYQRYNSGERWHRSFYNGTWSAWVDEQNGATFSTANIARTNEANVWSGSNTFNGALQSNHASGVGLINNRTNSSVNSTIEYRSTGGSVYAGMGASGMFAVGSSANLSAANWFAVSANGIATSNVDVSSGVVIGDGVRMVSSNGVNYLQSGSARSTGTWQNLRIGQYGSTGYNLEVRSTGIHVTGRIDSDSTIQSGTGVFQSGSGTADLVASGTGAGIRLLPNGWSTLNMAILSGDGDLGVSRDVTANRYITATGGRIYSGAGTMLDLIAINQPVALRPNGYSNAGATFVQTDGTLQSSGSIRDSMGEARSIVPRITNSTGNILAAWNGMAVYSSNNTNYTWTLPSGWPAGTSITLLHAGTAGTKTINPGSGVTLRRGAANGSVALSAGQHVTILALSETFYMVLG